MYTPTSTHGFRSLLEPTRYTHAFLARVCVYFILQVRRRAKNVLSLQCGACHARQDLALPAALRRTEPLNTASERSAFDCQVLAAFVRPRPAAAGAVAPAHAAAVALAGDESVAASVAALAAARSAYLEGSVSAAEFVRSLHDLLRPGSLTKGGADGRPCPAFLAVLHSLVCRPFLSLTLPRLFSPLVFFKPQIFFSLLL